MRLLIFMLLLLLPLNSLLFAQAGDATRGAALNMRYAKSDAAKVRALIKESIAKAQRLRRKAKNAAAYDLGLAARYLAQAAKLDIKVAQLKNLLREITKYGECPPSKSKVKVVIDNDSRNDLRVIMLPVNRLGKVVPLFMGNLASGASVAVNRRLEALFYYDYSSGTSLYGLNIQMEAVINGQVVRAYRNILMDTWPKKKRPCVFRHRFRVANKDFPAPKLYYGVFAADLGPNTSNALYVGSEVHLKALKKCNFVSGGNDCTTPLQYRSLSSIFPTIEEAGRHLCSLISRKVPWNGGGCGRRFDLGGGKTLYWGCEPSVNTAINSFCPQFK